MKHNRKLNEAFVEQDEKFTREVNALFKTEDVRKIFASAYEESDDNARASLMGAVETEFLDKFAKDGSGNDENPGTEEKPKDKKPSDNFMNDASGLDSSDDGSDDGSDDFGTQSVDDPFADTTTPPQQQQPTNPFESRRTRRGLRSMNESERESRRVKRMKKFNQL